MFIKIFLFALASLALAEVSLHDPHYCYSTDPIRPQLGMFSSRTNYDNTHGNSLNIPLSTCTPVRLWMFARGGSRLPSAGDIRDSQSHYQQDRDDVVNSDDLGRTTMCRLDADRIRNWSWNSTVTEERAQELTDTGFNELSDLAQRLQAAFPQVLNRTYVQSQFRFRHSYRERTEDSAMAIANGLFGHTNIVLEITPEVDRFTRPIDHCPLHAEVNSDSNRERNAFRQGVEMQQLLNQVNAKLGLRGRQQLSWTEAERLADYCQFEQSWAPTELSPWCAVFSIANWQVLEYQNDVGHYYSSGYGNPSEERLFSNINCYAMRDLLGFITNPNENVARFAISHSSTIRLFLVTLGALRDEEHLTRHNFAQQIGRHWNGSRISPMSSNFVFVHAACQGEDNDILVYFNERPLTIPGCEAPGLCKQQTFVRLFQRFMNANCEELFCSRD